MPVTPPWGTNKECWGAGGGADSAGDKWHVPAEILRLNSRGQYLFLTLPLFLHLKIHPRNEADHIRQLRCLNQCKFIMSLAFVLLEIFVISQTPQLGERCMFPVLSEISSQSTPKLEENLSLSLILKYVDKLVHKLNQQF